MDLSSIVVPFAAEAAKLLADGIRPSSTVRTVEPREQRLADALSDHLKSVLNWSSRMQIYGMSTAQRVDGQSVELDISTVPRRFRTQLGAQQPDMTSEGAILADSSNYLLLGDPGAGKTTTLKRLARSLLVEASESSHQHMRTPLVIRLREHYRPTSERQLPPSRSKAAIAETGISERMLSIIGAAAPEYPQIAPPPRESDYQRRRREEQQEELYLQLLRDRMRVLASVLDKLRAVVLLDGLDEVSPDLRPHLENDLVELNRLLAKAKLIASCRSGDHVRQLEGFDVVELCPLTEDQVTFLVGQWTDEPEVFLEDLYGSEVRELGGKPLFLAHIFTIYRNSGGVMPDQPTSVYARSVELVLRDWNEQQGVPRRSRYARFSVEDKREFLSALSHELTYEIQSKEFSHQQLVQVYKSLASRFYLPLDEAGEVAREIETHTGLIVESGYEQYEFAHLTLQEYLCGYYLARDRFSSHLVKYVLSYPAPVAMAIVLSANSSDYLAHLILDKRIAVHVEALQALVDRILIEQPRLGPTKELGLAMLALLDQVDAVPVLEEGSVISRLLEIAQVQDALRMALPEYSWNTRADPSWVRLTRFGSLELPDDVMQPDSMRIHKCNWRPLRTTLGLPVEG